MTDEQEKRPNRELPPNLQAFEAQLASLLPTTGHLERDRLMFDAGKAAAQSKQTSPTPSAVHWVWPTVSTVMTAAAGLLLVTLIWSPGPMTVKSPANMNGEIPDQVIDEASLPAPTTIQESTSDPNDQKHNAPGRVLASLLKRSDDSRVESTTSYFHQRNLLLAFGGDSLPEFRATPSAKGGRSNTRVSYMDLLDELTLESHGFAPSDGGASDLKPLSQGTDL